MKGSEIDREDLGTCIAPGCRAIAARLGQAGPTCKIHYQRFYRNGSFDLLPKGSVSRRPEYRHWINMRSRCNTPSSTGFEHYGARGIRVCPEWDRSFEAFFNDMGPRPSPRHSLDRIDVNGDYEPTNCRWATPKQQGRNTRSNHIVTLNGVSMTLADAVDRSNVLYNTVIYRLKRGWSIENAVGLALQKGRRPE